MQLYNKITSLNYIIHQCVDAIVIQSVYNCPLAPTDPVIISILNVKKTIADGSSLQIESTKNSSYYSSQSSVKKQAIKSCQHSLRVTMTSVDYIEEKPYYLGCLPMSCKPSHKTATSTRIGSWTIGSSHVCSCSTISSRIQVSCHYWMNISLPIVLDWVYI